MSHQNFQIKTDPTMKRSFLMDYNPPSVPTSARTSLMKRSSFNMNTSQMSNSTHYQSPSIQLPKTPKSTTHSSSHNAQTSNNNSQINIGGALRNEHFAPCNYQYYHHSNYNYNSNQNSLTYHISQQLPPHPSTTTHSAQNSQNLQNTQNSQNLLNYSSCQFRGEEKKLKDITNSGQQSLQDIVKELNIKVQKIRGQVQGILLIEQEKTKVGSFRDEVELLAKDVFEEYQKIQNRRYFQIKEQVQMIRKDITLGKFAEKDEVQERINNFGNIINKSIELISKEFTQNIAAINQSQNKARHKDIQKLKKSLQQKIQEMQKSYDEKANRKDDGDHLTQCSSTETIPAKKVFIGDPILMKYATKVSITVKQKIDQIQTVENVYKIDNQGYLLDGECRYILNSKYQLIKLSPEQIQLLTQNNYIK